MSAENKKISRRLAEEVISQGKTDLIDELVADDYVGYDIANPEPLRGREGVVEQMTTYRSAFSDLKITIHEQIAEGDRVVTRWRGTGTHTGDLMGMTPTGKQTTVEGVTIDRIKDGKIVESYDYWDTLGLLQQLGAIPEMATA
jgi:steroid delta-isomerase-like uncharacterized protein